MLRILLLFISIAVSYQAYATAPENLDIAKKAAIEYHNSGAYEYDISTAIDKAKNYLAEKIAANKAQNNKKKLAIVFDIDETAISTYNVMVQQDFASTPKLILDKIKRIDNPAIPETLALYNYAKKHGLAVFFITGRGKYLRSSTIQELKNAGYKNWNHLYLCNSTTIACKAPHYRVNIRKSIIKNGYDIVLNVGDQYGDLREGYADYKIKLPNPYYYIP